jgi:hypothetical protein
MKRRLLLFLFLIGILVSVASQIPIEHSKTLNFLLLLGLFTAGLAALGLWGRHKSVRFALFAAGAISIVPFVLPGRPLDTAALRQDYVARIKSFEGTEYYWGGESHRGIDCSGLPRRALRDALIAQAIGTFNGRGFRAAFEQWWFDSSALALAAGYRDFAKKLDGGGKINELDTAALLPGDFAVTASGTHLLAYVGDGKWSQADPGLNVVITQHGQKERNSWFQTEVTLHRWSLLQDR